MQALHRAFAVVMLLTACTPRDAHYDPSHFALAGAGAPPDVVLPAGTSPGSRYGGIVTAAPSVDAFCCVAGPHLDLPVRMDHDASALVLGTYLGETPTRERMRITFPGNATRTVTVGSGFSTTRIALPVDLRGKHGPVRIRIDASIAPYTLASLYFE